MLECRAEEDPCVTAENVLGAIAVVNIEVDDGYALEAVNRQGMGCAHGDIVEETKSHGTAAFGVMARRSHRAERLAGLAAHHQIHRMHDAAGRMEGGVQRLRAHRGIAVQPDIALSRSAVDHLLDVIGVVHPQQLLVGGLRGVMVQQDHVDTRRDQAVIDSVQPRRLLRVMVTHHVHEARVVRNEGDRHLESSR